MKVLMPSQIQPGMNERNSNGASQPPRNMVTARIETSHMLAYSARKNMAKLMPEYSIMARDDLRLAFHHVERVAVGLGQARDEVDEEDGQQRQPVPRQEVQAHAGEVAAALAQDHVGHVQAARDHQPD